MGWLQVGCVCVGGINVRGSRKREKQAKPWVNQRACCEHRQALTPRAGGRCAAGGSRPLSHLRREQQGTLPLSAVPQPVPRGMRLPAYCPGAIVLPCTSPGKKWNDTSIQALN